jgi:ribose 5-phosphate isomerase B
MMRVCLGSDHAGYDLKCYLTGWLKRSGYEVVDKGPFGPESVDYPDFAHSVANAVQQKEAPLGILICGSGNGVCISANKHDGIRAALCWNVAIASLARQHNDANIACLPARFISRNMARNIVKAFLTAEFEGGRHAVRVNKIPCK